MARHHLLLSKNGKGMLTLSFLKQIGFPAMKKTTTTLGLAIFCLSGVLSPLDTEAKELLPPKTIRKNAEDYQRVAQEPGAIVFSPPKGWHLADANALPPHVRVMVVGKGSHEFPPSINLSTEEFEGTLKDYLRIVKEINLSQGSEWKDLGTLRTAAGEASLSQADAFTEWGKIRMMHVILYRNGVIYILTAAALQEEFPRFYKTFFESLRSLRINQDPDEMAELGSKEPTGSSNV
jgi:hypothetical protein